MHFYITFPENFDIILMKTFDLFGIVDTFENLIKAIYAFPRKIHMDVSTHPTIEVATVNCVVYLLLSHIYNIIHIKCICIYTYSLLNINWVIYILFCCFFLRRCLWNVFPILSQFILLILMPTGYLIAWIILFLRDRRLGYCQHLISLLRVVLKWTSLYVLFLWMYASIFLE